LQQLLYADRSYALLIILQAMDAGGKDGTIRHVMSGSIHKVASDRFQVPTPKNARMTFCGVFTKRFPERGDIGIFNRSHYEDVLIVRVHRMVPKDVWSRSATGKLTISRGSC